MCKKTLFIVFLFFFMLPIVNADTTYVQGIVTGSGVNVRTGAGTSYSTLKNDEGSSITLSYPMPVQVLSTSNGWCLIKLQYGGFYYTGYMSSTYINQTTYTVLDSTVSALVSAGFPQSYAEQLAIVKTIHPNWTFVAYNTGLDWNTVISNETAYPSRNLISGTNTTLRSTVDGAYNNGVWTEYSGTGWYAASAQTVKYYMDPRNFFHDDHIFMFEKLSYDEDSHTESMIQSFINNTFMSGSTFKCLDGTSLCYNTLANQVSYTYARTFIDAAIVNTTQVSPLFLASRVIQEQGSSGGSALISGAGYNGSYVGYYDYFNINASGTTNAEIITNGLAYAQKKGWDSPYASIVGGSTFIGNEYIGAGQDTLYFQKFDVVGSALYSHQYMQNVEAPYSESYTTYKTYYNNSMINSTFTFSIPVYSNMPSYTTLSDNDNEDATLKSLSVSGCTLSPSFTSSATNYTCNVINTVSSVTISAQTTSGTSTVSGTGTQSLASDSNTFSLVVTSSSGMAQTYTVVVNKVDVSGLTPDDILSNLGIDNSANIINGFDLGTNVSTIINLIKNTYPSASVTSTSSGTIGTGTTITITNNGTSSYSLLVYGDGNGDGVIDILDLLKTQKDILGVNPVTGIYKKALDVNKDNNVDILDLLKIQKQILGVSQIEQ